MSNVVNFPKRITTEHDFGGCPHCGDTDGFINVGRDHWFICDSHKTKWCIGSNLFSSWREEDEATWHQNQFKLAEYTEVVPVQPDEDRIVSTEEDKAKESVDG